MPEHKQQALQNLKQPREPTRDTVALSLQVVAYGIALHQTQLRLQQVRWHQSANPLDASTWQIKIGSITNGIKTIQYYPFYSDVKRVLFKLSSNGIILLYKMAHTFWLIDSCDVCLRHHLETTSSRIWGRNIKLRNKSKLRQFLCCLDSKFVEYLQTLDWRNKNSFASFKYGEFSRDKSM